MHMKAECEKIIQFGKKLIDSGLTVGTGGNLSVVSEDRTMMAITPSGIPYYNIKLEDIVIMDLNGNVIEGTRKPSSEYEMHSIVYRNRPDVKAMIHTHSLYATSISCLRVELPAVDYLVAFSGGASVPIAEYASFGTKELAENALEAMGDKQAVLLANHGINVVGRTLEQTYDVLEQLEFCAKLYWHARAVGAPVILPSEEMNNMVERFADYGQKEYAMQ
ncbi:MAG: L-fuculose-phosphate aldolase [Bacillus sp. (in: firmicutes)]